MARLCKQVSNGHPQKQNDLASLSTEVPRLRLQALNLLITGGKATLISRLNLATGTKQPHSTSNSQAWHARTKRLAPKSQPVRATLTAAPAESSTKQADLVMTLRALRLVATLTKSWRNFPRTTRPILSKPDLSPPLNWPPYRTPSGPRSIKHSNHSPSL